MPKKTAKKKVAAINPVEDSEASGVDLKELTSKCKLLWRLQTRLQKEEAQVKRTKAEINQLEANELPEAMAEAGITKLQLANGYSAESKPVLIVNLPALGSINKEKDPAKKAELEARREEGLVWLEGNGGASLIKRGIHVDLGQLEEEDVEDIRTRLGDAGIKDYLELRDVHPQTLAAFMREKVSNTGILPPEDVFKTYSGNKVTISKSRKAKK